MKKAIVLMLVTLTLALAIPHMPESDGRFMLSVALGGLIVITIRMISNAPGPRRKPIAWGVVSKNNPTPTLKG